MEWKQCNFAAGWACCIWAKPFCCLRSQRCGSPTQHPVLRKKFCHLESPTSDRIWCSAIMVTHFYCCSYCHQHVWQIKKTRANWLNSFILQMQGMSGKEETLQIGDKAQAWVELLCDLFPGRLLTASEFTQVLGKFLILGYQLPVNLPEWNRHTSSMQVSSLIMREWGQNGK